MRVHLFVNLAAAFGLAACPTSGPTGDAPVAARAASEVDALTGSFTFAIDGMRRVNGAL